VRHRLKAWRQNTASPPTRKSRNNRREPEDAKWRLLGLTGTTWIAPPPSPHSAVGADHRVSRAAVIGPAGRNGLHSMKTANMMPRQQTRNDSAVFISRASRLCRSQCFCVRGLFLEDLDWFSGSGFCRLSAGRNWHWRIQIRQGEVWERASILRFSWTSEVGSSVRVSARQRHVRCRPA